MILKLADIEKMGESNIMISREATSYKAEYENQLLLTKKSTRW